MTTVTESRLPLKRIHRGKVRDVYEVSGNRLLLVASDRVSAFDVVMAEPVPRKGEVLTQISAWWLSRHLRHIDHHLLAVDPDDIGEQVPAIAGHRDEWAGRASLVRRTRPVLVECVVRGYVSGSAWKEYARAGTLAGEPLPPGLRESESLPAPVFSPATKAQEGHDQNITFDEVVASVGGELAHRLRDLSFDIYARGREVAEAAGIILADTKFEFGTTSDGGLLLIDEVMTPDSSRFWPRDQYAVGRGQPSLDKQPIRDYLDGLEAWEKQPPPPPLPESVIEAASKRYLDVFERLTGVHLDDFEPPRFGS